MLFRPCSPCCKCRLYGLAADVSSATGVSTFVASGLLLASMLQVLLAPCHVAGVPTFAGMPTVANFTAVAHVSAVAVVPAIAVASF